MGKTTKKKARKKTGRNSGMMWFLLVLLLFLVSFMGIRTWQLKQKEAELKQTETELASQISAEGERTEELENYSKWKQTLMYIEQVAREKLGLVFPGEVILKPEK